MSPYTSYAWMLFRWKPLVWPTANACWAEAPAVRVQAQLRGAAHGQVLERDVAPAREEEHGAGARRGRAELGAVGQRLERGAVADEGQVVAVLDEELAVDAVAPVG